LLAPSAQAASNTWNSTTGNWSDPTKWTGGTPASDVSNTDVEFANTAASTSTVDSGWASGNGSVHSLIFDSSSFATQLNIASGVTFNVGAGGLTNNGSARQKIYSAGTLNLTASQAWVGNYDLQANLSGASGVVITIGPSSSYLFSTGNSDSFAGSWRMGGGTMTLGNNGQGTSGKVYGRLGTGGIRFTNDAAAALQFDYRSATGTDTFDTPITLGPDTSTSYTQALRLYIGAHAGNVPGGTGSSIDFSAGISGNSTGIGATRNSSTPTGGGVWFDNSYCWSNTSGGADAFSSLYSHKYKFILSGASTLSSDGIATNGTVGALVKTATVVINNVAALGTNNGTAVGIGDWNNGSTVGEASALLANSGFNVSAPLRIYQNDSNSGTRQNTTAEVGINGAGSVTYSGNLYVEAGADAARAPTLRLYADFNGKAKFTGVIQDSQAMLASGNFTYSTSYFAPVVVLGGVGNTPSGTIELAGHNTYQGTTAVRSGTLLLDTSDALGNTTSAVALGDTVTPLSSVAAATTGLLNNSTIGTTAASWSGGVVTFKAPVTMLDGATLAPGQRVLVKDQTNPSSRNGIYVVSADLTSWTRANDFDATTDVTYGAQVHVDGGDVNGGTSWFVPAVDSSTSTWTLDSGGLAFHQDAVNPDVALLTNAPITVARNIDVTANASAGKSILGGNSADASAFSGAVTLHRALTLMAADGGSVNFSGDISGGYGVRIEGAGKIIFSTAKSYADSTAITSGTLQVDDALASSGIALGSATLQGTGTIASSVNSAAGTIAPGDSAGTLTIDNALVLDSASTLSYQLNGADPTAGSLVNDLITGLTSLTLDGTLDVSETTADSFLSAYAGESWRLINYAPGNFNNNVLELGTMPALPAGLTFALDTETPGEVNLTVTAVPEPASLMLAVLGTGLIARRRRRS
jgi:autotransporter-associated beta strand protein